ncbi:LytR C-terminal domain-containing protein [Nocardioides sp. Y6]|uniref:LytR C-terminal domain-containing protein n=1 Tax=Nocardioides malaquae TaxID=2773426 RepID=A0ABR9RR57_9ACTN|nr:LytR C-terminal domain-containing protein [Nocardioides malaquae]MBE7324053.1 LytR C-terminal domain-containing protein [Nocardioides malaquae]
MDQKSKSRLTLASLVALLVVAAVVGWQAMTAPFPVAEDLPPCVDTSIAKGQEVFPDQVTVSVFNASRRNGLASRTMNGLTSRGFVSARTGNAPDTRVRGVQIWSQNAKNPAVALVRSQFRRAKVTAGPALGPGVVVVVGDGNVAMKRPKKSPTSYVSTTPATICSPPGSTDLTD